MPNEQTLRPVETDWVDREARSVNERLTVLQSDAERLNYLKNFIRSRVEDEVFGRNGEITPIHQNSIQTIASFVRRLDRGTVFAAGMLFSLSIVTFFAARR